MSTFDIFFFLLAWASGVILALSTVVELGRRTTFLRRRGKTRS